MSAWLYKQTGELKVANFKRVFGSEYCPELTVDVRPMDEDSLLLWKWGQVKGWPDWQQVVMPEGVAVLLDGYLTESGDCAAERGASQTDLLTDFYQKWREDAERAVTELNGSFSIIITKPKAGGITAITDRWGSRPIWFQYSGELSLSNHAASLVACGEESPNLDPAGVWSLLATNRPVGNRSIYQGIQRLGAGTSASFEKRKLIEERRWFNPKIAIDGSLTVQQWGSKIAAALQHAAKRIAAVYDEQILYLSGGMDSRVAAAALGGRASALTITTHDNMNSRTAGKVAKAMGMPFQVQYRDDNWYLDRLFAAGLLAAGNYHVHHAHFFKSVEQLSFGSNTCFLLGDLLENFNKHYYRIPDDQVRDLNADQIADEFSKLYAYSHKDWERLRKFFQPEAQQLYEDSWRASIKLVIEEVKQHYRHPLNAIDALFRWHDMAYCPTNLMLENMKPMAGHANLMLDNDLYTLLFSIPPEMKGSGQLHKAILRKLDKRLLWVPNSNFWLPPIFPDFLHRFTKYIRPKIGRLRRKLLRKKGKKTVVKTEGSWHMMHMWYRSDESHRRLFSELLSDSTALDPNIFDHQMIQQSLRAFLAGDLTRSHELYSLFSLALLNRQLPTIR